MYVAVPTPTAIAMATQELSVWSVSVLKCMCIARPASSRSPVWRPLGPGRIVQGRLCNGVTTYRAIVAPIRLDVIGLYWSVGLAHEILM